MRNRQEEREEAERLGREAEAFWGAQFALRVRSPSRSMPSAETERGSLWKKSGLAGGRLFVVCCRWWRSVNSVCVRAICYLLFKKLILFNPQCRTC